MSSELPPRDERPLMARLHHEIVSDVSSTAKRWRCNLRDVAKAHWASFWAGITAMILCGTQFVETSILPTLKAQMASGDFKKIALAMLCAGVTQFVISFVTRSRQSQQASSFQFQPGLPPQAPPSKPFPKW